MKAIVFRDLEPFGEITVDDEDNLSYSPSSGDFPEFISQFDVSEYSSNLEFVRDLYESLHGFFSIYYSND